MSLNACQEYLQKAITARNKTTELLESFFNLLMESLGAWHDKIQNFPII